MKRITKNVRLSLIVILLLSFQLTFTTAKAEQPLQIIDGVYQVELSFQSLEAGEQGHLFGNKATLTVRKGQKTLSVSINNQSLNTVDAVEQSGKQLPFLINKNENLVEFDVIDIQKTIEITGTIHLHEEEKITSFKEQLMIDTKSLPKLEKPDPKPEPEANPEKPGPKPDPKPEEPSGTIPDQDQTNPSAPQREEKPVEINLDFKLLVDGKTEPSIMNTYVDPKAKVIQVDGGYKMQMKIIKAAWVTRLKIEQNGEMIEPKTISLENNGRTIEFTVNNLKEATSIWVKVDIPEINYHHDYQVHLVFDQEQVTQLSGQTNKQGERDENDKEKQDESFQNSIKEVAKTPEKSTVSAPKPIGDLPVNFASPISTESRTKKSEPEELLAFDRLFDQLTEEVAVEDNSASEKQNKQMKQQPVNTDSLLSTADKIKIGLLVFIFIVSGYLLIRRFKRTKKDRVSE